MTVFQSDDVQWFRTWEESTLSARAGDWDQLCAFIRLRLATRVFFVGDTLSCEPNGHLAIDFLSKLQMSKDIVVEKLGLSNDKVEIIHLPQYSGTYRSSTPE